MPWWQRGFRTPTGLTPGESHGFRRAENQIDARESELSFYGQVMGFEPPGDPEAGAVARRELTAGRTADAEHKSRARTPWGPGPAS